MYSNCQLYDYQIEVLGKYMFWTLKLNKIDGYLRSAISSVFFNSSKFHKYNVSLFLQQQWNSVDFELLERGQILYP